MAKDIPSAQLMQELQRVMTSDQQESGTTHEGCNLLTEVFHGGKDDNMRIMISLRCNSLNKDEADGPTGVSGGVMVAAVGSGWWSVALTSPKP